MISSKTPFFQSLESRTWMWKPRISRIRWLGHLERSTGWIAEVSKLNVVAQKRRSRPTKICDGVLVAWDGLCCPMSKDYGTKF